MRIGIDFDNTIVCYDHVIYREALRRGWIPPQIEPSKSAVRDHLRSVGQEQSWIELQGHVYGPAINEAEPFPGAIDSLAALHQRGTQLFIISHKTRFPVLGPQCDLHKAARGWLLARHLLDPDRFGLTGDRLFFEETRQEKLARIAETGCTHFIDDLPEFLREPDFPTNVERIHFDPHRRHAQIPGVRSASSWDEIRTILVD